MTSDRWPEIDRILAAALERRPDERSKLLDTECAGDEVLRREVESLLVHGPAADEFLEHPALHDAAQELAGDDTPLSPDPQIGGYTILKTLGEGGMGVVYLAEQAAPIRRQVALKLIKPGMDTRQVVSRFEAERQVLALMHHPHIAAVFDAGTTGDGRPYFVMEYVDGVPITEYCDHRRLSMRARLELFIAVCEAVQHAHQKGVIHRDLKPSNVLVSGQDGRPLPKIIDFGVARAIERAMAGRTAFTEQGVMVGTPEYMSPEQAALSPDIDTSTDVYSLGVLLYELLVGALPFDPKMLRAVGYDEMRRIIRESDPPKPSSRLTGDGLITPAAAVTRHGDAVRLTRELKGDLDWITLKALEKDRRHRYTTVAAFAADVAHYLANEPIAARPPSVVYRMRKFTGRYRGAVLGAAAVFLMLVAGLTSTVTQYVRAERQLVEANQQRTQAEVQRTAAEASARDAAAQRNAAVIATDDANRQRAVAASEAASANDARQEAEYRAYVATISAADGELRAGFPAEARRRLLAIPVAQRGWEWQHLFLNTDTSLLTLASPTPCARPDEAGGRPFTASDNALAVQESGAHLYLRRCATLDVWDRRTLAHVAYQADGKILASGPTGEIVVSVPAAVGTRGPQGPWNLRLVNPTSGRTVNHLGPFKAQPICANVSPDGTRLAVGLQPELSPIGVPLDDVFETWNVQTKQRLALLAPSRPRLRDSRYSRPTTCQLVFSHDSRQVASSGATVHVWLVDSGDEVASDQIQAGFVSQPVAFNADGSRLAIGRLTGLVDLLDVTTARPPDHLDGNGFIKVLPLPEGDRAGLVLSRRVNEVLSVAFSPDGTSVITGTGVAVGIWNTAQGRLTRELVGHAAEVIGVTVAPDGSVVSADASGQVKVWSPEDPGAVTRLPGVRGNNMGQDFALSDDGSVAVFAQNDGGLTAWRLDDPARIVLRAGRGQLDIRNSAKSVVVTPDGRQVLTGETDGVLRSWTMASQESTPAPLNQAPENGCEPITSGEGSLGLDLTALSPDGRTLAFKQGRCIVIRDLAAMKTLATMRIPAALNQKPISLLFRRDGSLLFTTNSSILSRSDVRSPDKAVIWDWRADRVRAEVRLPPPVPTPSIWAWRVTASADGRRIALYVQEPSIVSVWDGTLKRELGRLPVPPGTRCAALSPDGHRMATSGLDNAVRVWDTDRFQLLLILTDDDQHAGGLAFTTDGRLIAGRSSGGLTIWDTRKKRLPSAR